MRVPRGTRERGTYIGGHDAARIVGLFPYGAGIADTYAAIIHKRQIQMSPKMLRGLLMEPGFAAWVQEQRGIEHERDVFLIDDEIPFFAGSVDAIEVGGKVMHEFTTTTSASAHMWGTTGTDDCATHKYVQCQWYMGLEPALTEAHVWCFIVDGDEEPLHYIVPRNEVAIRELRMKAEAFWFDHILTKTPPLAGVHDSNADESMNLLFPTVKKSGIEADVELISVAKEYDEARKIEKEASERKKTAGARIKAILGEHEGARWDWGSILWKDKSIGEKTHWEQIAHEAALASGMDGRVFNSLVRKHTYETRGIRSLRVSLKKG